MLCHILPFDDLGIVFGALLFLWLPPAGSVLLLVLGWMHGFFIQWHSMSIVQLLLQSTGQLLVVYLRSWGIFDHDKHLGVGIWGSENFLILTLNGVICFYSCVVILVGFRCVLGGDHRLMPGYCF